MSRIRTLSVTAMSTALVLSLVASVALLGAGVASAEHPDDAPDLTDHANFRTEFPATTDHYPGDVNEENGSILYSASGADAFAEQDAEDGVFIDWIIVHAEYEGEDWIDYSACSTDNTEAFGIDRGDDKSGSQFDEDLVQKQKEANFLDNGITIDFYDWNDFGGDPPYMAPEDAIVAAQGAGSSAGTCLTLTDEPGWYRVAAFMNGTVADNGPDEQPSENAKQASLELNSNYMYVCECEDEDEAREQLGPPPNEQDGSPSTPTPTESGGQDTPEPTPTATESGGNGGSQDTPQPTATESDGGNSGGEETAQPTATEAQNGGNGGEGESARTEAPGGQGSGNQTPTPGDGPGFTGVAAILALLASALLASRRD